MQQAGVPNQSQHEVVGTVERSSHSALTIGDHRHCSGVQAGPQDGVFLAGVAHTNDVLDVRQDAFDELVGQDGRSISKAKQRVVREHHLHARKDKAGKKQPPRQTGHGEHTRQEQPCGVERLSVRPVFDSAHKNKAELTFFCHNTCQQGV